MTKLSVIEQVKAAVDAGLSVTLAASECYTVIKDSNGKYLIEYRCGDDSNWIGLHGREGTKYEHAINMPGDWIVSGTGTIKG